MPSPLYLAVLFLTILSCVYGNMVVDEDFIDNLRGFAAVPMQLPPPQQDSFHFQTADDLPAPDHMFVRKIPVPANCASYHTAGGEQECPSSAKMTAVMVTYDDCGSEWTVCRCSDAQMTLATSLDRLGRIPVGLRRYVNTVAIMADDTPHAYTLSTGDMHVFGDIQQEAWLHEATHTLDFAAPGTLSGQKDWREAISNDSCIPDNYAGTNAMEDFAQVSVVKIYSLLHGGLLPPGFDGGCMKHQLDYFDTLEVYNPDRLLGSTCAFGEDDPNVRHIIPPSEPTTTFSIPASSATNPLPSRSASVQKIRGGPPTSTITSPPESSATSIVNAEKDKNASYKLGGSGKMTALFVAIILWMCW